MNAVVEPTKRERIALALAPTTTIKHALPKCSIVGVASSRSNPDSPCLGLGRAAPGRPLQPGSRGPQPLDGGDWYGRLAKHPPGADAGAVVVAAAGCDQAPTRGGVR